MHIGVVAKKVGEAILYAPTFKWGDKPIPAFWNGPVVKTIAGLERALRDLP